MTAKGDKIKLIVVVGPTASGKSDWAVNLAKAFDGEVISADSRQVYRGLNIGTGKVTKKEMAGVPHHLLDVANPRHAFNAAKFKELAEKAIQAINEKGKTPIIAGGTGFYIDALLGKAVLADVPPNEKLRKNLEKKNTSTLFTMLKELDKKRAKTIDPHNRHRLIRAIEVAKNSTKAPLVHKKLPLYEVHWIGIKHPKEILQKRIHTRLLARMRGGMVAEAKRLHASGLSYKRMRALGLEYRYLAEYLTGKLTKEEVIEILHAKISQYAKRQMTWFKRNKNIHWHTPKDFVKARREVEEFLKD